MSSKTYNIIITIVFTAYVLLFSSVVSAVHKGAGDLTCGNCHTMHNSQGNAAMDGASGGSILLLRANVGSRAEIHKLCLQCHASNGSQAGVSFAPQNVVAPKVYSSATWTDNDSFVSIGAGGNFSSELDSSWNATDTTSLGYGHSMGITGVMPPGGDQTISFFTCTSCHDPHGTADPNDTDINVFRNLKVSVPDGGAYTGVKFYIGTTDYYKHKSYVGGVNGSYFGGLEGDNAGQVIWPVFKGTLTGNPGTDASNSNSYGTGTDTNSSTDGTVPATMSRWCAQCHDKWHEAIQTTNLVNRTGGAPPPAPLDSLRHAVNSRMERNPSSACASCHGWPTITDRTNYSHDLIVAGKGIPVTAASFAGESVYYLPVCGDPGVTGGTCGGSPMDYSPGNGDQHKVFCLTCHFAHGGPYYDALRWDYTASVGSGTESGKGIPSNKGCQLCHNRGGGNGLSGAMLDGDWGNVTLLAQYISNFY